MIEEEIVDYYNSLVDSVNGELSRIYDSVFPENSEVNYFVDFTQKVNDIIYKLKIDVDPFDVFMICHRTYNHENDYDSDYKLLNENRNLIEDVILNSVVILKFSEITNKTEISFNLDCDKFKGTFLDDSKYLQTFDRACRIYFWNRENAMTYVSSIVEFLSFDVNRKSAKKLVKKVLKRSNIEKDSLNKISFNTSLINDVDVEQYCSAVEMDKAIILEVNKFLGNNDLISDINSYYRSIGKRYNKFIANLKKEEKIINELVYQIKNKKLSLPLEIPKKIFDVVSFDTMKSIFENSLRINSAYYDYIVENEEYINNNSNSSFCLSLESIGYNLGALDEAHINFLCLYGDDEVLNIIKFVKELNYELIDLYSDNGLYILINTSMDNVSFIDKLYNLNIISLKFIKANPDIFFDEDLLEKYQGRYNLLSQNYDLISNFEGVCSVDDLLLYDSSVILSNINMLNHYDLDFNKNLIVDINNFNYVDYLIELGCYDILKNNILVINEKIELVLKRIYISKLMHINFSHNMEFCDFILTGKNFYVADSKLDDFIINNVNDYLDKDMCLILNDNDRNLFYDVDKFDDFLVDDMTYRFGDILVSKNKFLRNCNCLLENNYSLNDDVIFNSLIYGSVFNYEELNYLKDFVYSKGSKELKKK